MDADADDDDDVGPFLEANSGWMPRAFLPAVAWFDQRIEGARSSRAAAAAAARRRRRVAGVEIEITKGRRDAKRFDSASLAAIVATLCAMSIKVLLMVINANIVSDVNGLQGSIANIVLMFLFCTSLLTFLLGIFATSVRSIGLVYVFMWAGLVTMLLELALEAIDLAVLTPEQTQVGAIGGNALKQQFIFFIFLGQVLQGVMVAAAYHMYRTLKSSRQEETVIRVHRLGASTPRERIASMSRGNVTAQDGFVSALAPGSSAASAYALDTSSGSGTGTVGVSIGGDLRDDDDNNNNNMELSDSSDEDEDFAGLGGRSSGVRFEEGSEMIELDELDDEGREQRIPLTSGS